MNDKLNRLRFGKPWRICIVSGLVLLLIWIGIFIFKSVIIEEKTWFNYVDITGTEVDNNYNNYLSGGDLCRVENKLYFNYRKNAWHYGLMEISNKGSKRIAWHGLHPDLKGTGFHIEKICKFNKAFYRINNKGIIDVFNLDKNSFEEIGVSVYPEDVLAFVADKIYYLKKSENTSDESLELVQRNYDGTQLTIAQGVFYFYILNNKIYYGKSINFSENGIFEYDLKSREEKTIISYATDDKITYDTSRFMVQNGYIFITKIIRCSDDPSPKSWTFSYKFFKIKLNDKENIQEIQDIHYPNFSYNIYKNSLYVCTNSGIDVINIETDERKNLTQKPAKNCYILDDYWVYFVDSDSILWRITNGGSIVEKVFG